MLSLSIDKKLDYSSPIFFVPLGIATTTKINPTPIKKATPQKIITPAKSKPTVQTKTSTVKPTTIAAPTSQKVVTPEKKIEKIEPKPEPIKKVVKAVVKETPSSFAPLSPRLQSAGKAMEDTSKDVKTEPNIKQTLDTEQQIVPVIPENAQISHNYREVEALRRSAQLQKELVQQWKPPIGVSPDCMCEVSFFVNSTGTIENIKMEKTSGVMMFDISARQALFAMQMPQWSYGKPFTINFRQ